MPRALILSLHCVAHLLQIVFDAGSRKTMMTPLYQLTQVMANGLSNARVQGAMESLAITAEIIVGVEPPPEDLAFNDLVLKYTVDRPFLRRGRNPVRC